MTLLLVSHGQPSAPDLAEAELSGLAAAVQRHLPDTQVLSATLANPGALARATAEADAPGQVYPLFMAGGWFTRVQLPSRLNEVGAKGWTVLEPMGCDPHIHALVLEIMRENLPTSRILLAAHGSGKSPAPAAIASNLAARVAAELGIPAEAAFLEQSPRIAETTGYGPDSLCLPFFAASGSHVTEDVPHALKEAGFQGRVLPALGLDPRLPALIAIAARQGQPICAETCRAAL
jgi:sirohydrochlorin ferrochelatase